MGNNGGGCGTGFIALLLAAVVFGAGFLFSQDTQQAYEKEVADAALVQAVQQAAALTKSLREAEANQAALAAENEQMRASVAVAVIAKEEAERAGAAAVIAKEEAERAVAAAVTAEEEAVRAGAAAEKALADAQAREAALGQALQDAEARASAAQKTADEAVKALAAERAAKAAAQPAGAGDFIPVTSGENRLPGQKMIGIWLLPGVGIAIFGTATITAGWKALRPSKRNAPSQDEDHQDGSEKFTYVKMTREEARQYARQRRM